MQLKLLIVLGVLAIALVPGTRQDNVDYSSCKQHNVVTCAGCCKSIGKIPYLDGWVKVNHCVCRKTEVEEEPEGNWFWNMFQRQDPPPPISFAFQRN